MTKRRKPTLDERAAAARKEAGRAAYGKAVRLITPSAITLGERIAVARKEAGLTQEQLAERANIAKITVGRYERGAANPGPEALVAICRVLGVSADALLGLKERP